MTSSDQGVTWRGGLVPLLVAVALTIPGVGLRFMSLEIPEPVAAGVYGLAIVGAAFVLSWAAEAAQVDISAGLAIAVLALIAVLPEYAVDMVFAIRGGNAVQQYGSSCQAPDATGSSPCDLALANMTGANRILVGVGWALVVFLAWSRWRKHRTGDRAIELEPTRSIDVTFLTIATMFSLTLPLRSTIALWDSAILVALFCGYAWRIAHQPPEEPDLIGPSRLVGELPTRRRRLSVVAMFLVAAAVILAVAEHFADSLVATGAALGISEFFLVQWLAPIASEAPELLVAGLYAWRLRTSEALGTLVSSKVNQWTLLVGTLPIVFAFAAGSFEGLPVSPNQREELLLTAAQSAFAMALLVNLELTVRDAVALLGLFLAQFLLEVVLPAPFAEYAIVGLSGVYLVLAVLLFVRRRHRLAGLFRDGLRTPVPRLAEAEPGQAAAGHQ